MQSYLDLFLLFLLLMNIIIITAMLLSSRLIIRFNQNISLTLTAASGLFVGRAHSTKMEHKVLPHQIDLYC
jgi:hypothetical protein